MNMKKLFAVAFTLCCMMTLLSCQKASITDFVETSSQQDGNANVTFNIKQFEQIPFNNAKASRATDLKDLCSNISVGAYLGSELVKNTNQKSTDPNFGTLALALDEGTYQVVIVANKKGNSPTMKNLNQIKVNGGLSDTFFWSQEINVEDGEEQSIDVNMVRNVAMVRFLTTDSVPENISTLKFVLTGGSSSFNGYTGIGYENSTTQTITINVDNSMKGKPGTFELFTFPKTEEKSSLKISITGLNAGKNTVFTRKFEGVPILRNQITVYKGKLFEGSDSQEAGANSKFTITTDNDEWTSTETEF